jgi:4-diphosphocytidyl-2-C-methyl-D-erythritol kinase
MTALRETARAKLNLTLEVLGRRGDGYHELRSLVAFAQAGDTVELEPGRDLALTVEGPFGGALAGGNLIIAAAEAARAMLPALALGRFRLIKDLPVSAGLGGGSADAAATLRLLARANPGALDSNALTELAAGLGSDVTACLESRPALMLGRGERVLPVASFPPCAAVLVNPGLPLATRNVFAQLNAPPLAQTADDPVTPDFSGDFARLVDYVAARTNDLETAAISLAPVIREILQALAQLQGARVARLSGSGPTCFALFRSLPEAETAVRLIASAYPDWRWAVATALG